MKVAPGSPIDVTIQRSLIAAGIGHYVDADTDPFTNTVSVTLPAGTPTASLHLFEGHLKTFLPVAVNLVVGLAAPSPGLLSWAGYLFAPPIAIPAMPVVPVVEAADTDPPPPTDPEPKTTEERQADDRADGSNCYRCGVWAYMAAPNRPNGQFECNACAGSRWRPGTKPREE